MKKKGLFLCGLFVAFSIVLSANFSASAAAPTGGMAIQTSNTITQWDGSEGAFYSWTAHNYLYDKMADEIATYDQYNNTSYLDSLNDAIESGLWWYTTDPCVYWTNGDYSTATISLRHEVAMNRYRYSLVLPHSTDVYSVCTDLQAGTGGETIVISPYRPPGLSSSYAYDRDGKYWYLISDYYIPEEGALLSLVFINRDISYGTAMRSDGDPIPDIDFSDAPTAYDITLGNVADPDPPDPTQDLVDSIGDPFGIIGWLKDIINGFASTVTSIFSAMFSSLANLMLFPTDNRSYIVYGHTCTSLPHLMSVMNRIPVANQANGSDVVCSVFSDNIRSWTTPVVYYILGALTFMGLMRLIVNITGGVSIPTARKGQ